jgi:hypothetical protein
LFLVIAVWYWAPGVRPLVYSGVNQAVSFLDVATGGAW